MRAALLTAILPGIHSCTPASSPEPPAPQVAYASNCAANVVECYDEFATGAVNFVSYRAKSRWNKTHLTWRLRTPLPGLNTQDQIEMLANALERWAEHTVLTFERTGGPADLEISFAPSEHGDEYPFDGPGVPDGHNILGHAFFPGSLRPGQSDLDERENWVFTQVAAGQIDFFTVALHETGHALGLVHTSDPQAAMYPGYHPVSGLNATDIENAQLLYGSRDLSVLPQPDPIPGQLPPPPSFDLQLNPDSDGDGIPDSIEVLVLGSDPFSADSDGDGQSDFAQTFVEGRDPAPQVVPGDDTDDDGLSDVEELRRGTDPARRDTDADGLTDGREALSRGTDPLRPDTDGDGVVDGLDPFATNAAFPVICDPVCPASAPPQRLLIANQGGNGVIGYQNPAGVNGEAAPDTHLSGRSTALGGPVDVVVDAGGALLVGNAGTGTITSYEGGAAVSGDLSPDRVVTASNALLDAGLAGMAYDAGKDLLFAAIGRQNPSIAVFSGVSDSSFTGDVAPVRVMTTDGVLTSPSGLHLDAAGSLYVADADTGTILVYADAASADGEVAAARTITGNPSFSGLADIFVDARDRMYVVNSTGPPRIDIYRNASALSGSVAPDFTLTIPGAGTLTGIAIDDGGRGYIVESAPSPGRIYSYDNIATLHGAFAPTRTIAGPGTQLSGPFRVRLTW